MMCYKNASYVVKKIDGQWCYLHASCMLLLNYLKVGVIAYTHGNAYIAIYKELQLDFDGNTWHTHWTLSEICTKHTRKII